MFSNNPQRRGFTLMELLVVILILVIIAALVIPRISGATAQAHAATNATIVRDVNNAVMIHEARYGKHALGWDSLLNSDDDFFSKLHPNLTADTPEPLLQIINLDANQAASLQRAGIVGFHDAVETRVCPPSDNSTQFRFLAEGTAVTALVKTPIADGHGSTFIDNAFNINQYKSESWDNEFIVCGLGGPTGIKGRTLTELPLVQSADPTNYYARALCVYMVPATGSTKTFAAQYVGCFLPDRTSQRQNVDNFSAADVPLN